MVGTVVLGRSGGQDLVWGFELTAGCLRGISLHLKNQIKILKIIKRSGSYGEGFSILYRS